MHKSKMARFRAHTVYFYYDTARLFSWSAFFFKLSFSCQFFVNLYSYVSRSRNHVSCSFSLHYDYDDDDNDT